MMFCLLFKVMTIQLQPIPIWAPTRENLPSRIALDPAVTRRVKCCLFVYSSFDQTTQTPCAIVVSTRADPKDFARGLAFD